MNQERSWRTFGYKLDDVERSLRSYEYRGAFDRPSWSSEMGYLGQYDFPNDTMALLQTNEILSEKALGPPHGIGLLQPPIPPEFPALPEIPTKATMKDYHRWILERHDQLRGEIGELRANIEEKVRKETALCERLANASEERDPKAIRFLMQITLRRHPLPAALALESDFAIDAQSRIGLCTVEIPDMARLAIVKKRGRAWSSDWTSVSATEKKRLSREIPRALCVRAAYLVAMADPKNNFDTVAVNAHQKWFDPATGTPKEGIVASLQATKIDLCDLNPGYLDVDACFKHLAGIATPDMMNASPVRPIFELNKDDQRIVANKDVAANLDRETNLASMPWDDFEHLVRQLFEWMFDSKGIEVNVTRASRDRGVDAIIFDPDPIRGGKYVIQAKRYTRPVDVAAVRDLYGTVMNEGANRGILVSTSSYGPDAYEFAKDKPISLVDGPNLLQLLRKHGRDYRIDLEEARRANTSGTN